MNRNADKQGRGVEDALLSREGCNVPHSTVLYNIIPSSVASIWLMQL